MLLSRARRQGFSSRAYVAIGCALQVGAERTCPEVRTCCKAREMRVLQGAWDTRVARRVGCTFSERYH